MPHDRSAQVSEPIASVAAKPRTGRSTASASALDDLLLRRAAVHPATASAAELLELQRRFGNRAVHRLLTRRTAQVKPRATGLDESRALPLAAPGGPAVTGMPARVRAKMEAAFGADFSDVRVHPGSTRAVELGALAYTQGKEIYMAPGYWAPETARGQELLGHELAHVVQQAHGLTTPMAQLGKLKINHDSALEKEADELGRKAMSQGQLRKRRTAGPPGGHSHPQVPRTATEPVVQRKLAYFKPPERAQVTEEMAKLDQMAKQLDAATEMAHLRVVEKLRKAVDPNDEYLLNHEDFLSSTQKRFVYWVEQLRRNDKSMKAAATGSVIEDIVTAVATGIGDCRSQVPTGGARLDFVIQGGGRRGIVDVTSSGELGHVLDKSFNPGSYLYVVESVYPSIDFSNINETSIQMGEVTAQMIESVRAMRADKKLGTMLNENRQVFNLISTAQRHVHHEAAIAAASAALGIITRITSQGVNQELLDALEAAISCYNTHQPRDFHLQTVAAMLEFLRGKYGVEGLPPWS